jgi:16S rRNA pseudouridine516 synthase
VSDGSAPASDAGLAAATTAVIPRARPEPLDRFLVRRLRCTWSAAHQLIQRRRIEVNGARCPYYHQAVRPDDEIACDGVPVIDAPEDGVVLCHKRAGVACSHQREHAPLLYDEVPAHLRHPDLQAAGRLDRDTTGLIVLTIDGPLIQRLTAPGRCAKRYRLRWRGRLATDAVERVAAGLAIADDPTPCLPADLAIIVGLEDGEATLLLREGRNHQVKRMIRALGAEVTALHRERIGGLDLPADCPLGTMRAATAAEVSALFA